jgi:CheY-like chemotaxis protein
MAKAAAPKKKEARARFADSVSRQPSLLIVDSEAPLRMALSGYLQDCGFKVFEAASAKEACAMLEKSGVPIDLVLADVALPGVMDGFALAGWIRSRKPEVQVVLAASDASKTKRAEELCENEPFFAKPYDLKQVMRALRTALGRRGRGG